MLRDTNTDRRRRGFSLTELSVVAAALALLVAVAVPSASRLAGSARTTTCLSRIGQMTAAFLTYTQDYNGDFPFIMRSPRYDEGIDPNEDWLAAGPDLLAIVCTPEDQWPNGVDVPRSGSLFTYTGFDNLYKCPEFERVDHPEKTQNVFNYTRALWARYWRLDIECHQGRPCGSQWGDVDGPIMKVAMIHKPSELPMVLDEQFNRFVATSCYLGDDGEAYNGNDCLFGDHSIIGVYHGPPVASRFHNQDHDTVYRYYDPFLWKRGGVGYYDGHAGLMRDPWPSFRLGNNDRTEPIQWRLKSRGRRAFDEMNAIMDWMEFIFYAQRGFSARERYAYPMPPFGL